MVAFAVAGTFALWAAMRAMQLNLARRRALRERVEGKTTPARLARPAAERTPATLHKSFPKRWLWVPWLAAALMALGAWLAGLGGVFVFSLAALAGLLTGQVEAWWADRQRAAIEAQLAEALDIAIGALYAGGGVTQALEAAAREARQPFRAHLQDVLRRIRLGDDPARVYQSMADRVPMESFRLTATTLAVHSSVGGSLAPTLASVARTIHDRMDIARRTRTLGAQAKVSTAVLVGMTFVLFLIVWRQDPARMESFLATETGRWLLAGALLLQPIGIVWQARMSRPRF
ncbi:MAG: type II secretion system F family protein [Sumerlaeia bacterium]